MIGGVDQLPVAVADRAGLVRGLGIGEILGGLCHQPTDLVGPQLDAVRLRQDPARHVDDLEAHRLRRVVGLPAGADRSRVGIKLEGIERRRLVGVRRQLGGEPGDNARPPRAQVLDAMTAEGVPLGKKGYPEDIANGVLWLASEESRYVTGAELVIDGGLTVK